MGKSHFLSTCLLAAAPLLAQGSIVSHPAFANAEGDTFGHYLLGYSNSRFQYAEGEIRGNALSLNEVAFRLDHHNHTSNTAMGRKWTKVTLSLADTDWTKMTATFTQNQFTTPVEVFNAAYDVPSVQGTPFLKPTPFGGKYAFPFKSPYSYSGSNDLLLDFVFRGGTMDNSIAWSGGTVRGYYLDSNNDLTTYTSPRTSYPAALPNPRCRDSAITSNSAAYTYATIRVYGITYSNVTYREKAHFELYSYYTAPDARVITAIAFAGIPAGLDIGARCNLLYVNLQGPWIALGRTTQGNQGYSGTFVAFSPWIKGMANVPIWVQTAWDDSSTKMFSLTTAQSVVLPGNKPMPRRVVSNYYYVPDNKTGYLNIGTYHLNQVTRYSYN